MARRATPKTKGPVSRQKKTPVARDIPPNAPRPDSAEAPPNLSPEPEMTAATTDDSKTGAASTPLRRGRKPKANRVAETPIEFETAAGSTTSDAAAIPADDAGQSDPLPAKARRGRARKDEVAPPSPQTPADQPGEVVAADTSAANPIGAAPSISPAPSAARWDPTTGTATFDWPTIEQVAATDGPNQAMAKLLLAARAEGANSRWPF